MSYIISSICIGPKYEPIKKHWIDRINKKCKNKEIFIIDENNISKKDIISYEYGWWDVVRLKNNIYLCIKENKPIVHIDIDIIVEKELDEIINLPYDIIISTEINGNKSFPQECSKILGFGVCTGFFIIKKSSIEFMLKILNRMKNKFYNSLSDQVTIMNHIVNSKYNIVEEDCILNGIKYKNRIIEIDNIKICVLDFNIITRDPIITKEQYANHINIDNVGGVNNFIRYFYEPLEDLPLTCRCGKIHLGDNNICNHKNLRKRLNI